MSHVFGLDVFYECDVLKEYEKVDTVVYLAFTTEANAGSTVEIRCRIALGKSAMTGNVTFN